MQWVAEEPENLTLRILQELREEMKSMRTEVREAREEARENNKDLTQRIDGNTLTFNLVAGVVYDHEARIEALENR